MRSPLGSWTAETCVPGARGRRIRAVEGAAAGWCGTVVLLGRGSYALPDADLARVAAARLSGVHRAALRRDIERYNALSLRGWWCSGSAGST
jgi:hypothetical protein